MREGIIRVFVVVSGGAITPILLFSENSRDRGTGRGQVAGSELDFRAAIFSKFCL